jgi:hypothetical protein
MYIIPGFPATLITKKQYANQHLLYEDSYQEIHSVSFEQHHEIMGGTFFHQLPSLL